MSERKGTKALELWCKRLVKDCPEVKIENMTTSWRNGLAFCALVHHFRPDLVDMTKLKPEDIYENNQLAFSIAEKHLGIPSLLDPEDMVENEVPDRLSVLTYLSQFYQRLGHTVNTKTSESESKGSASPSASPATAPFQFGKTGLDKCAVCELPVYLAQRLIVSHKLYHRRCFRCSKCSGHMNRNNYELTDGSDFICDSCKNDKSLSNVLNNNDDQMGMLAFVDDMPKSNSGGSVEKPMSPTRNLRPHSILEKISIFESKDNSIENIGNLSLKDSPGNNAKNTSKFDKASISEDHSGLFEESTSLATMGDAVDSCDANVSKSIPEKSYKSNVDKFIFLQTQLTSGTLESELNKDFFEPEHKNDCISDSDKKPDAEKFRSNENEDSNVTDDIRIANTITSLSDSLTNNSEPNAVNITGLESSSQESISIPVPPRKNKLMNSPVKTESVAKQDSESKVANIEYPEDLNPFSDDEEDDNPPSKTTEQRESTNPFGSSDEEDDAVPSNLSPPTITVSQHTTPARRLIAVNPFWSDGEEPSSDEDCHYESPKKPYESALATSTPTVGGAGRRRKAPAPPPPRPPEPAAGGPAAATSMDDVASLSSFSSQNSTIPDHKCLGTPSPRSKKRLAPTPPESLSGSGAGSLEPGADSRSGRLTPQGGVARTKRPAPGLPLPERRSVRLQLSPEQLQVQLDLLETQQLGLERQGVVIEQMIRDKCEGDEASTVPVPQEEVEDLVIQLCELVNEKNDLFRKQTELMYIRRQQRLEQEQADIEHEIRVIQSRPAVNRIDADKAREEQLVSRLVRVVRLRDELVQQIEAERRRERQEDLAIAASIATKRAQRNTESKSSSLKSDVVAAVPKKNKVKDKVKKQLKKAKNSLISKKKEDSADRKDAEKGKSLTQ